MWEACYLAFSDFSGWVNYQPLLQIPSMTRTATYVSIDNISKDSRDNPQLLKVTLKQSKTDPFCLGVDLYPKAIGATICPVKGLLLYFAVCAHAPLFIIDDGKYLTYQYLCALLNCLLIELHINTQKYSPHSFHIGTAPRHGRPIFQMPSSNWWKDGRATLTWPTLKLLLWSWLNSPNT